MFLKIPLLGHDARENRLCRIHYYWLVKNSHLDVFKNASAQVVNGICIDSLVIMSE